MTMQVLWHFDRENEVHLVRYDEMITAWLETVPSGTEFTVSEVVQSLKTAIDQDIASRPNPDDYDKDIVPNMTECRFEDEVKAVSLVLSFHDEATKERYRYERPIYIRRIQPRYQDSDGQADLRYERI